MRPTPHLPINRRELRKRGWDWVDVVLVSGDAYVDHPSFPAALLGRLLESKGYRVGIVARPDIQNPESIAALGLPRLFFGVTSGALDSMVANTTAQKKRRSDDPYAPGGIAGGRPDRALTVYCNLIRRKFGKSAFIVGGGIEASLRRFAHYDYWSDSVRRPILMDCGADVLVHGMGEGPIVAIADALSGLERETAESATAQRVDLLHDIDGLVYREAKRLDVPQNALILPSSEKVAADAKLHASSHHMQESNRQRRFCQESGGMRITANPPWPPLSTKELDAVYALPFSRNPHPVYKKQTVPALEQVRFSVTSHRGCFGGCSFCAIGTHQGKTIQSRSKNSILKELREIARHPDFKGTVNDVGGPTANMYGLSCTSKKSCNRPSCLWPKRCKHLDFNQNRYLDLLREASKVEGINNLFVTTGIRLDLILHCRPLLKELVTHYTSGHFKVAPEHVVSEVLNYMRKPAGDDFKKFLEAFAQATEKAGKKQKVIPYLIAAHPGSTLKHMVELMNYLKRENLQVEQCQIFTPTPGTTATVMYATGLDPATLKPVFVEKTQKGRQLQKSLILYHKPENALEIAKAVAGVGASAGGREDKKQHSSGRRNPRKRSRS